MAKNPYKIKKHTRIYRRSAKGIVTRIMLVVIAAGLLFGVGWILYSPVTEFIAEQQNQKIKENDPILGESDTKQEEPLPLETIPPIAQAADPLPAGKSVAFLTNATVSDPTAFLAALPTLKAQGYDSVMVGLKLSDGTVAYQIQYNPTTDLACTAANAFDLAKIAEQIKAAGLIPAAHLHAFRDHRYPAANKAASTRYLGGEYLWFDNSPSLGGRPWMNPFSSEAQAYIRKITADAVEAGFQNIVLESVQFPEGYALDQIDYGSSAALDKQTFLQQYTAGITAYAQEQGAALSVLLPAPSMLGDTASAKPYFGDTTPLAGETVAVNLSPEIFGKGMANEQISIPSPQTDLYNTVKTASAAIKAKLLDCQVTGLLQGNITTEQLQTQIKALTESGISRTIVENPPLA